MPVEASTLVNFGDWAAQWDEQEEAWFVLICNSCRGLLISFRYFYNYLTEESTWEKPDELSVCFKRTMSFYDYLLFQGSKI